MKIKLLVIIIIHLSSMVMVGQEKELLFQLAEEIAEMNGDPLFTEELMESFRSIEDDPVKINSGRKDEIGRLFFLTEFQIASLIDYTRITGDIVSVYEIAYIQGFDSQLASMMTPFVSLEASNLTTKRKPFLSNRISFNLTTRSSETQGFNNNRRMIARYKLSYGDISAGFTAENDAGEISFPNSSDMPDFFSGWLLINRRDKPWKIILGDYSLKAGQGVALNTSFRTGINTMSNNLFLNRNDLKPYNSAGENMFLRGMAASWRDENYEITAFVSRNNTDATLWEPLDDGTSYIMSFYTSGLHDSPLTSLKKDAAVINTVGAGIEIDVGNFRLGTTGALVRFSHPLLKDGGSLETSSMPSGKKHDFSTFYLKYHRDRSMLWGEATIDVSGDVAAIAGVRLLPVRGVSVNLAVRNYPHGFYTYHGNALSAFSGATDERGITASIIAPLIPRTTLQAGVDVSQRIVPRSALDPISPSIRSDIRVLYTSSDKLRILFQFQHRAGSNLKNLGGPSFTSLPFATNLFSISPTVSVTPHLELSTRIIHKKSQHENMSGNILFVEGKLVIQDPQIKIWSRYTLYDTESYSTRLYVWENDLVGTFNVAMLSGRGAQWYIMAELKPMPGTAVRIKYSVLTDDGESGEKVTKSSFRFQIRISI